MSGDGPKVPNASPEPPDRDDWRTTFRPDIPSSARIYDYFLGGKDNYPPRGPDAAAGSRRICRIYAKPPKSAAHIAHGTADSAPQVRAAARVYDAATTRMFVRSREEVLALVRGLEVVAPGLVWTPEWRLEPSEQVLAQPSDCYYYALVARKP